MSALLDWVRGLRVRFDVHIVLIGFLIFVSTGHVGLVFAEREDARQAFVGYVLALSVDGVLAVSLYEAMNVRRPGHRVFALATFVATCLVSAGFNVWYYRLKHPQDAPGISALLGATAPVLAAALAVLKSFGDIGKAEREDAAQVAERAFELDKLKIAQAAETERALAVEQERTKQERARARAEQARADTTARAKRAVGGRSDGRGDGRVRPGELDEMARAILAERPDIGPRPLARELGCAPSTAGGILARLRGEDGRE